MIKPVLLFDGDCGFCRRWIARWQVMTLDKVEFKTYQEEARHYPQIPEENFKQSVQLIEPDGRITSGAEAVFRTLAFNPSSRWMLWVYEKVPFAKTAAEFFYKLVAKNRIFFSGVTRFFFGGSVLPSTYNLSRFIFLKAAALIYLAAFFSLAVQIRGLLGANGILPAGELLAFLRERFGGADFWQFPTLFWLRSDDFFLQGICWLGAAVSILAFLGILPGIFLLVSWFLYLSLVTIGQDFLSFQWDNLLLEAGFLAVFLAPVTFWDRGSFDKPVNRPIHFVLRFLLFKLMFSSGIVKLASGDASWRNLTALQFHYETQPLPWVTSWFAHQVPASLQKFSCAAMFLIELVIPFFFFFPRRLRHGAAAATIFLQTLIFLTGNYCFFNLLSIALCLLLIDDEAWKRFRWFQKKSTAMGKSSWQGILCLPVAALIFVISLSQVTDRFGWRVVLVGLQPLEKSLRPFRSVNHYGLFAVMTTTRPEIIVEGSLDGLEWKPYEFKYKPGDLSHAPQLAAPYQPRLDWQMWFAALGTYRDNPWFVNFCLRLLQGKPEVLALVKQNPFPDAPPKFVRALVYEYHFTTAKEREETGAWWKRTLKGNYLPAISLKV